MKNLYLIVIVALIIIMGSFALYSSSISGNYIQLTNSASQNTSSCMKISDTPYAQYTYLISGNQLSQDAQTALSGFNLAKNSLANGDMLYTLTTTKAGYINQSYTLKPGDSLYFIETSFGDDNYQLDTSFSDDTAVVVDSNGCILQ